MIIQYTGSISMVLTAYNIRIKQMVEILREHIQLE